MPLILDLLSIRLMNGQGTRVVSGMERYYTLMRIVSSSLTSMPHVVQKRKLMLEMKVEGFGPVISLTLISKIL